MKDKDDLIRLQEDYIGFLGEEIKDLATIACLHGWTSKRLKKGAEFRTKIAQLKNKIYNDSSIL